jgi:hypothetical protein
MAYVFSLGFWSNQDIQSDVCCSQTRWQIQERVTHEGVEGSIEVAHLASISALSLPRMAVCLGTQWTMMVEPVLFMSVVISWMSRVVSCLGPQVRYVVRVIGTWLSVNMWIRQQ